jgi:excisionase family DNA binding protein
MLRLAHTEELELDDDTEESVTVTEAARRLGCDPSTVRELLNAGELTGHRVGKFAGHRQGKAASPRGVRVHVAAIRRYKARHTTGGARLEPANDATPPRPRVVHNPAGAEAKRRLRALGLL